MARIFSVALALFVCANAHAATCTWTGAGADDKWSTAANWDTCAGIRTVPINTDTLVFPDGAARKTNTNDIVNLQPAALQLNGLNYDISGNAITLTPGANSGITVNTPVGGFSDLGPRFRPNVTLGGTQTFSCASGKFLYVDGALNLNGKQLGIDGPCNVALRGTVSGSGDINKFGTGFLYLSQGPYSYGGITTINNGTVYVGTDTGLGSAASSTYVEPGGTLSLYLGVTIGETIFLDGGTLENFIGDNEVSGDVVLSTQSTADVAADTTLTLSGALSGNSGGLSKTGPGTLVVTGFGGNGISIDAGTAEVDGSVGAVNIGASTTLRGIGTVTGPVALNKDGTLAPGTRDAAGTLAIGGILPWYANAYVRMRLGKTADRITVGTALLKPDAGYSRFAFTDGATPPAVGVEYTLIEYPSQTGFDAVNVLTYQYEGTGPGALMSGILTVTSTKITFKPTSVTSDLIFRSGVES